MQYKICEMLHKSMSIKFGPLAKFFVEFLDREAVEVWEEEGSVVFLQQVTMLLRVADYILYCLSSTYLLLGVSTHSIIENDI